MKPDKSSQGHLSYRPDIDGLRAVAILSVLGFHAFPAWFPGGFIGVDVFFVISGFLISSILISDIRGGHFSLATFYARRIRRIFPALILVLAAALGFGYFVLWPGEYKQLAEHALGGVGFLANIQLQGETGYFAQPAATNPLLHLWSLGVEEQFYIFWPLLLWAGWKLKHHLGWMIATVFVLSFATNIYFSYTNITVDFFSPFTRFWELLAGGALAWNAEKGKLRLISGLFSESLSFLGLLLLILADFTLKKTMLFPGSLALLPICGACFLIAAGKNTFINRKIMAHPLPVYVGLISYPLYLWHWPLISYSQIISGEPPHRLVRIAMVVLSFLLAAATYKFVEQPIRKRSLKRSYIVALVTLMLAVGVASTTVYINDGFVYRFADKGNAAAALDMPTLIDVWQKKIRVSKCYLQDPTETQHAPECVENEHPLLLLWGDSHAASLYPGLKKLQETSPHPFGIAELTQAGCPPLFDIDKLVYRPDCNDINRDLLSQLPRLKPDLIVLNAAWSHEDYPMSNDEIVDRIISSVATIQRDAPKAKIVVIGPAPRWLSVLPGIYRRYLTFENSDPPLRMTDHLDQNIIQLDTLIQQKLAVAHIAYLSAQQPLCNEAGCLTRIGPDPYGLTFIDDGHFTTATSEFVISAYRDELLSDMGLAK